MILKHKHMIVRAELLRPPAEDDGHRLNLWLTGLIDALGMQIAAGPIMSWVDDPGNRGWTAAACIKTSHVALHFWNEPDPAEMRADFYSCAEIDPAIVLKQLEYWRLKDCRWWLYDRENDLRLEDSS